tara:strand:+ start:4439 stop:4702 length:264 start_codon:yes stop_codon:yes gene_type:complete
MRIFVYKTLFIFICFVIGYKLTFGSLIYNLETKLDRLSSKENQILIKEKIKKEMRSAINKDQVLDLEDAILIKKFIEKINNEISNAN